MLGLDGPINVHAVSSYYASAHTVFLILPKALTQPRVSQDCACRHRPSNAEPKPPRAFDWGLAANMHRQRSCPPTDRQREAGQRHQINESSPPGIDPDKVPNIIELGMIPRFRSEQQRNRDAPDQSPQDGSHDKPGHAAIKHPLPILRLSAVSRDNLVEHALKLQLVTPRRTGRVKLLIPRSEHPAFDSKPISVLVSGQTLKTASKRLAYLSTLSQIRGKVAYHILFSSRLERESVLPC